MISRGKQLTLRNPWFYGMLVLAVLGLSCQGSGESNITATPDLQTPTGGQPTPAATAILGDPFEDTANLGAHPKVDTVLIGVVVERVGEETTPTTDGLGQRYANWSIRAERYLVGPLNVDMVFLRVQEAFTTPEGQLSVPRWPYLPQLGSRGIFFLTLSCGGGLTRREGFYCLEGQGHGHTGPFAIQDGYAYVWKDSQLVAKPLDDFVDRVVQIAQEAGKTTD